MAQRSAYFLLWSISCALIRISATQTATSARPFDGCSTTVTVDAQLGGDCSSLPLGGWDDLDGSVCSRLQDVLEILNGSDTWSDPYPADCVEVYLVAGDYEITAAGVISGVSVILRGEYHGTETFTSTTLPPECTDIPTTDILNDNNINNNNNNGNQMQTPAVRRQAPPMPPDETDLSLCDKVPYEEQFVVHVNLSFTTNEDGNTQPFYAWSFLGSAQVEVTGIDFSSSPGILGFEDVGFVSVENCSFSYFIQGAVDIFNCAVVSVTNSVFAYNGPANILKPQRYRGHSAALSIAYNYDNSSSVYPLASASTCVFYNNSGFSDAVSLSSIILLRNPQFPGRGGALALIVNSINPSNITIQDCVIERNYVATSGAGVFILLSRFSNHLIQIYRTLFRNNNTPGVGGGLQIEFRNVGSPDETKSLKVYDSVFSGNVAQYGGGAYFLPIAADYSSGEIGDFVKFHKCNFSDNVASEVGSAIGVSSPQVFAVKEDVRPLEISDCLFERNTGRLGGVVGMAYFPLGLYGSNTFDRNRGTTFTVIGAIVEIHGDVTFSTNNDLGTGTGALYVTSLGQIKLFPGANVSFIDNRGGPGAAMVIEPLRVPIVFSRLPYNPLCTLLMEELTDSPADWHEQNVSFTFQGNEAIVSSAVLLSNLDLCSWTSLTRPFFKPDEVFRWQFVEFGENQNSAHAPHENNIEWYVQSSAARINITNTSVSAYPGESFTLGIDVYDELNRPVAAAIRMSDLSMQTSKTASDNFRFFPAVVLYEMLQVGTASISYRQFGDQGVIRSDEALAESILGDVFAIDTFVLKREKCPPGSFLKSVSSTNYYACDCNVNNEDIVDCEKGGILILQDHLWGSVNPEGSGDRLVTYPCPGGYCKCTLRERSDQHECPFIMEGRRIDNQCNCDRKGLLCGECKDGKGVSALLNRCVDCDFRYGFLIMGLIIADVLVVLGLLVVMVPFPPWLYPCVFHLQILPYLTEHFPVTFEKARPFLYYISSAIGFYFPYDFCLGEALDPRTSYAIRYIPFFVAIIVCPIVLAIRRYKFLPVPWHGLWWIVLLLYTPVVHTSMSLLNCPMITDRDGNTVPRWYIGGELKCFSDAGHAILALFAISVLVFCLLLIAAVVVFSQDKLKSPCWLHHLVEPLTADFIHVWWGGVELARRMLLLLFIVAFPNNDYPAIFVLAIAMSLFGLVQPYKKLSVNIMEIALSSTILVMFYIRNTAQINDDWQVLPDQSLLQEGNGMMPDCVGMDDIDGMTPMAALLALFYYVPLAVTFGVVFVWAGIETKRFVTRKCSIKLSSVTRTESLRKPMRPHTNTVVDINDLSPPPITPPGIDSKNDQPQGIRRPTTSIVQFQDLEEPPPTPHRIPKLEEFPSTSTHHNMNSHEQAAKVLSLPVNGGERDHPHGHEVALSHQHSNSEIKLKMKVSLV